MRVKFPDKFKPASWESQYKFLKERELFEILQKFKAFAGQVGLGGGGGISYTTHAVSKLMKTY